MPSVTSEAACDCCCPPDGKKCFQEWIASWSCSGEAWTGPVTDNRLCLPVGTSTDWVKIAGDASGCEYRKYVPYTPAHCCSVNGDCTSDLGDTATPGLPFGGAAPPDCCACVVDCPVDPDPGACAPGQTPDKQTLTFNAVASCGCVYNTNVDDPFVYVFDGSAFTGMSFELPWTGSDWEATFDITGIFKYLKGQGDGTGCVCSASPCTEDIVTSASMTISLATNGTVSITMVWYTDDTNFASSPDQPMSGSISYAGTLSWTTCCAAYSASGPPCVTIPGGDNEGQPRLVVTDLSGHPC